MKRTAAACLCLFAAGAVQSLPMAAFASGPAPYTNCTAYHVRYPHGVGKAGARDATSGRPVTNFLVSTTLFNKAMRANDDLDRDGDGIACEKR